MSRSATPGQSAITAYSGTAPRVAPANAGGVDCSAGATDTHLLVVTAPDYGTDSATITVTVSWTDATGLNQQILDIADPKPATGTAAGPVLAADASAVSPETVTITNPVSGTYTVRACSGAGTAQAYTAAVTVATAAPVGGGSGGGGGSPTGLPGDTPGALGANTPTFSTYVPPAATAYASNPINQAYLAQGGCTRIGCDAGEPSVGIDSSTGEVSFTSGVHELRATNLDGRGGATWNDISALAPAQNTLDPIGYVDTRTNRTFALELAGTTSNEAASDDSGHHWSTQGVYAGVAGEDHETLYSGPAPATPALPALANEPTGSYPDLTYYCAQADVTGLCAVSQDGGTTFLPPVQTFTAASCGAALHGHVKVSADGTAYLPSALCGSNTDKVAVARSLDGGKSFSVGVLDDTRSAEESDPSIATDDANTVYLGWDETTKVGSGSPNSYAVVGTSTDHGATFVNRHDVGASFGINNVEFPALTAGTAGRAVMTFLGSSTIGDDQDAAFAGDWYLFASYTQDSGKTWTTVKMDPKPVQRGCVNLLGFGVTGGNNCRNMFDFTDAQTDRIGRLYVPLADGCINACDDVTKPALADANAAGTDYRAQQATLVRQESGLLLFDTARVSQPDVVRPTATPGNASITVSWPAPAANGRPITGYTIYRSPATVSCDDPIVNQTLDTKTSLVTLPAGTRSYVDSGLVNGQTYCYTVSASNGAPGRPNGEGEHFVQASAIPGTAVVTPALPETPLVPLLAVAALLLLVGVLALRRRRGRAA